MKQITLNNFIKHEFSDNEIDTLNEAFKSFMLSTCRKGSRPYRRFEHFYFKSLETKGIYDRLVYLTEKNRVEYIAGQDYPGEIAYLKKLMLK